MAVSLLSFNSMLICANSANEGKVGSKTAARKPNPSMHKHLKHTAHNKPLKFKNWFEEPLEDKPITIDGKNYKNIDDFLDHIKVDKNVNTKRLKPGMKTELVELYRQTSQEGTRFRIFCAFRSGKHNAKNKKKAEDAGRGDYVAENSLHKQGLAVDLKTDELTVAQKMRMGDIWEKMGHPWGWHIKPKELHHFPLFVNTKDGTPLDRNGHKIKLNS